MEHVSMEDIINGNDPCAIAYELSKYTDRVIYSPIAYELSKWMHDIEDTQRTKASKILKLVNKYEDMHDLAVFTKECQDFKKIRNDSQKPTSDSSGRPLGTRLHKDMIVPMEESVIIILNDSKTKAKKNNRGFICKK